MGGHDVNRGDRGSRVGVRVMPAHEGRAIVEEVRVLGSRAGIGPRRAAVHPVLAIADAVDLVLAANDGDVVAHRTLIAAMPTATIPTKTAHSSASSAIYRMRTLRASRAIL
jgi:hypothetical protein